MKLSVVGTRLSLLSLLLGACAPAGPGGAPTPAAAVPIAVVEGFAGPESVRYDADQDLYFVGNFNGSGGAADNNGFISRMQPDGTVSDLRFIEGGQNGVTLHAPRGMAIVGDTLWAADVDAVRGFNRRTGAPVATIDFTAFEPGFLNDISPGPDGALYVTDTGTSRLFRIAGRTPTVALEDTLLNRPNGVTLDRRAGNLVILPYGGRQNLYSWRPGGQLQIIPVGSGGRFDGVEVLDTGELLVSSQTDSTLVLVTGSGARHWARTAGPPADIGVDTRRRRVAVPYIGLNRVDIWNIPR